MGKFRPKHKYVSSDAAFSTNDRSPAINDDTYSSRLGLAEYEPKRFVAVEFETELPLIERYFCFAWLIGIVSMWVLFLYNYCKEIMDFNGLGNFIPGWNWLGRLKDGNDFEWNVWMHMYTKILISATVHSIISVLVSYFAHQYRRHAWLIVGLISFLIVLGWRACVIILITLSSFFVISIIGSTLMVSILAVCWLIVYHKTVFGSMMVFINQSSTNSEDEYSLFYLSTAFGGLRIISFAIEKAKRKNGTSDLAADVTFNFFDALAYTFYVPNYYTGPVFIYKYFAKEVLKPRQPWRLRDVRYIVKLFVKGFWWMLFTDFILHFCYVHYVAWDPVALRNVPLFLIGGIIPLVCSFSQAKYCVIYGLPAAFMAVDGIEPPTNPRCVFRVCYFSDYWRYFDQGLHGFFRNYIYLPLGGSRSGPVKQTLATFVTFWFVSRWHAGQDKSLYWAMANCLAVGIEILAKQFVKLPSVSTFEEKYVGQPMTRRLHVVLNTPLLMFSIHGIMVFHTNWMNGWICFERLVLNGNIWSIAVIFVSLYALTVVSQEVDRYESRLLLKDKKSY